MHVTDTLFRPTLHAQGCWAHGFGFHFAVADADAKNDTTTNAEVVARMYETMHKRHGALPYTSVLIQDNTCREFKHKKQLKDVRKVRHLAGPSTSLVGLPRKGALTWAYGWAIWPGSRQAC